MNPQFEQFIKTTTKEAPASLKDRILKKILFWKRVYIARDTLLNLVSVSGLVLGTSYLWQMLQGTTLVQYASLLFSDTHTVVTFWYEISIAILESLPLTAMIVFFSTVLFAVWAFDRLTRTLRPRRIINIA